MIKELFEKKFKREENIKKKKLKEILSIAENIIIKSKNKTYKVHPINALIKALSDKAQQDFLFDLYSNEENSQLGGRLFKSIPGVEVNGESIGKIENNYKQLKENAINIDSININTIEGIEKYIKSTAIKQIFKGKILVIIERNIRKEDTESKIFHSREDFTYDHCNETEGSG